VTGKPSYKELENRVIELEQQIQKFQSTAVKYQTLFHSFPHGISISDAQGNIIETNAAAEKMLGIRKEEHENRSIDSQEWQIIRPDGSDMPPEAWASVLALKENRIITNQKMGIVKSGQEISWINVTAAPLPLEGHGVVVTYGDISDQVRTKEMIVNTEKKWQHILANTPQIGISINPDGKIIFANNFFQKLTGWTKEEIIGQDWFDLFIPGTIREEVRNIFKTVMTQKDTTGFSTYENDILTRNGEMRHISWANVITRDTNNQIIDVTCLGIDLTERKHAEELLKTSYERFFTVLNSIDATIFVADMKTHEILFMNQCMIDNFGRDMTGEVCWKAFRGESGPCSCCTNDQLIDKNGNPADVCVWHDQNPITGKWFINHDRAIEWTEGRLVRIQIATDITEYRKLEDKLLQAHKMDAIGTLAGGIAHDFNNILSSIIGFTELSLEDVEKGSALEDNLNEVFTAGKRARDLVKQILAFARQTEDVSQPIQVDIIIKEVIKLIRSSIPAVIEIRQSITSDSLILGNPTQIHQILMNLCSNAAYAMEDKGGILDIALKDIVIEHASRFEKTELKPGHYLQLTLADTGTGIPSDIIHSIFEPYFTTKPVGEGTGLGLSMVHGIVKSYGGQVTVESELGKGTVFTIYLPVFKNQTAAISPKPEDLPAGMEQILFVDDEEPIARMGGRILERLGYQVTTRTSSIEALELFRMDASRFDLVISDMTMPNMTGDRLAVELMKIRPDIPIILLTGYSKKISDETAKEIGIRAFAFKPIVKADLAGTIRKILDEAKNPAQ